MAQDDYLKYWRVIRYYYQRKHNLKPAELDTLLFLKSEKYFTKKKFSEFNELVSWNERRFDDLLSNGWIETFSRSSLPYKTIYQLSFKAKALLIDIYKKLSGEELSVDPRTNPLFKKNVKYTDKVYRNMIKEMNRIIRQQRHPSQE
jgi:hypothetical protein